MIDWNVEFSLKILLTIYIIVDSIRLYYKWYKCEKVVFMVDNIRKNLSYNQSENKLFNYEVFLINKDTEHPVQNFVIKEELFSEPNKGEEKIICFRNNDYSNGLQLKDISKTKFYLNIILYLFILFLIVVLEINPHFFDFITSLLVP